MWVGIKGNLGKRAGEVKNGLATLKPQDGKMVSSSKEKKGVLVVRYWKLGTPTTNKAFDAEFEKINAWAEANVDASEREDSCSDGSRELTGKEVNRCVDKRKNRNTAGAALIVHELMKYWGEGILTMMNMLYILMWGNEYAPARWREGLV